MKSMKLGGIYLFWLCLLLGGVSECGTAEASPRDDTLTGAFRCALVSKIGIWLDCYYGAAQPMRDALILPPALASQVGLARKPPDDATPVEGAVERSQVMADASRCDRETADRAWLNCYYAAAQAVRAQLGLKAIPQLLSSASKGGVTRSASPQSPRGVRLVAYSFDTRGFFTVTLSNGQVWRQESGDTEYAHWPKPAGDYVATIAHSLFGDFNMRVDGSSRIYKVHRVS